MRKVPPPEARGPDVFGEAMPGPHHLSAYRKAATMRPAYIAYIAFVGVLAFLILVIVDRQQSAALKRLSDHRLPLQFRPR
jgi:hypothetical protein